jgi:mannose-6-phosphate isomerase-like protein (cupin superfamily)
MDWQSWINQHIPFTEIQRGGAAVWPKGGSGLIGDPLGPIMHLHDGASEIFYFIAGRCRLEIGNISTGSMHRSEEFFGPGDFVLVPPEVPHNLWNAGDDDLLVFWLVAPNFVNNKWRTDNFPPGAMDRRHPEGPRRSRVEAGVELPGNANIRSRLLSLEAGTNQSGRTGQGQEAILYIVEGQAEVKVGKLGGKLAAHDFVHVPVEADYAITATDGPASVLIFEMPGG